MNTQTHSHVDICRGSPLPPHPHLWYFKRSQPWRWLMRWHKDTSHPSRMCPNLARTASESWRTPLFPATSTPLFLLPLCSPHSPPHEHLPGPISPGPAPITTSAWQLFKPTDSYLTEAFVLYCLFYVKKCLLSWKSTLENCAAISKWSTGLITPTCSSN